jgi:hypothetical protein
LVLPFLPAAGFWDTLLSTFACKSLGGTLNPFSLELLSEVIPLTSAFSLDWSRSKSN